MAPKDSTRRTLRTTLHAAGVTRVMAVPGVQALLPAWLRTGADADG